MSLCRYVFVICALLLLGCQNDEIQEIKDRGFLRVGMLDEAPPLQYKIDNDIDGLEIKLSKKIAKDLLGDENKVQFITFTQEARLKALESNEIDLIVGTYIKTKSTQERVDFSTPYFQVGISIINQKPNPLGLQNLFNAPLIVMEHSLAQEYFSQNYPNIKLLVYESIPACLKALTANSKANFASLNIIAYTLVRQNPNLQIAIPLLGGYYEMAPAVKKGHKALLAWLDTEIATLKQEGFFAQMYETSILPFLGEDIHILVK